jgi:RHS repeat-associated protein
MRKPYSAYGEKEHSPQPHEFLSSFSGKEYDGTGLIYFNARYYDPATGRFFSEDPARDGVSWYGYCGGNPLLFIDPSGLDPHQNGGQPYKDRTHTNSDRFLDQAERNFRYETDRYVRQKNAERLDRERPSLTGVPSFPYVWPTVSRRITSDYRSDPEFHANALDIGAVKRGVKGDPLYAIADGEIVTVGTTNGSSRLILLMENGDSAAYFHGEFSVTEGSVVKQGDIIGTMSDVGSEDQVHLHFEIRLYNDYSKRINPYYYYPRFYEFPEKLYELPYR